MADANRAEQYSNATPGFYRAAAVLTNAAAADAPWPARRRSTTPGQGLQNQIFANTVKPICDQFPNPIGSQSLCEARGTTDGADI